MVESANICLFWVDPANTGVTLGEVLTHLENCKKAWSTRQNRAQGVFTHFNKNKSRLCLMIHFNSCTNIYI